MAHRLFRPRESLAGQQARLEEEIDAFVGAAAGGALPLDRLTFPSNKVYKRDGNAIAEVQGAIGAVFARLAATNCELWHEQEKVYDIDAVPLDQRTPLVKRLAVLNLERTECIDRIDTHFRRLVERMQRNDDANDS